MRLQYVKMVFKKRRAQTYCVLSLPCAVMFIIGCGVQSIVDRDAEYLPVPEGWTSETRTIEVVTPEGEEVKEITFYRNSIGMEFVRIEAGEYMRGSTLTPEENVRRYGGLSLIYEAEHPRHHVILTKPFYMATKPVTREHFAQFILETGYQTDAEKLGWALSLIHGAVKGVLWSNPGFEQTDAHPVVYVSWNDAVIFCQWLSDKEGKRYRLPTEAEWEYAARAGTTSDFIWGEDPDAGAGYANVADLTGQQHYPDFSTFNWHDDYVFTSPVGSFKPNPWGLYDMTGNVANHCIDWFDEYPAGEVIDPQGPAEGRRARVNRGNSWVSNPKSGRLSSRCGSGQKRSSDIVGFRVCVDLE